MSDASRFLFDLGSLPLAAAPAQPIGLLGSPLVMMALVFGIFYLLLIRPARTKQKKHQEMLSALKNGDRVITNGGIHGVVVGVTDHVIQLRIADQVKIDVARYAVAQMQNSESAN